MLTIVYSYGRQGIESDLVAREVEAASNDEVTFVPFDHRRALRGHVYADATRLDHDYRGSHPRLQALHRELARVLERTSADCLFVTNDNVYHPDFLLKLPLYRAYYTTDDPGATYARTIPYLHAFDHVFHCALPYSPEKSLAQKLIECGARKVDFLPLGVFDYELDPTRSEEDVLSQERDIDIVYIGTPFFAKKLDGFLQMTRAFGRRQLKIFGFWKPKHSVYLSVRSGRPRWVRSVSLAERVRIYQRAKIGFNIHWDQYGLGNQRLYHLPANGVMQICDCPTYLDHVFERDREIASAATFDEMVDRTRYYLIHEAERRAIAEGGFRRVQRDYRIRSLLRRMARIVRAGQTKAETGAGQERVLPLR
jgi:spore maturation protein CgeB